MGRVKDKLVKLKCDNCKKINYHTRKNIKKFKQTGAKLALKKYCPVCKKHVLHKEVK